MFTLSKLFSIIHQIGNLVALKTWQYSVNMKTSHMIYQMCTFFRILNLLKIAFLKTTMFSGYNMINAQGIKKWVS